MNYKNSITYNLQNTRDKETLLNLLIKLSKRINGKKLQILLKNFEKRKKKFNANFEKLFEDSTNNLVEKQPILEEIQENESLEELLENTLNNFNYKLDDDFQELKINLLTLISNDKVLTIENTRYSYKLYKMFETIHYHHNLLKVFKKTSNDINLELEDKGVAYSSNRNTNETINPLLKKYESVKKTLKKNKEINGVIKLLNHFKKDSYGTIIYLNTINENTPKYFNENLDKDILEIILDVKKILNSAEGIEENDFYHSMRFYILMYFYFTDSNEFGFSSINKLKDLLNDILEEIVKIDNFRFDTRDFNQEVQIRNLFNDSILIEKVTPKNKRKHPILDKPQFIKEMKFLLINSLKKKSMQILKKISFISVLKK